MTDIPSQMADIPSQMTDTPNPGSDEARKQGCTCPVIENNHGGGEWIFFLNSDTEMVQQFFINGDCQLHGLEQE